MVRACERRRGGKGGREAEHRSPTSAARHAFSLCVRAPFRFRSLITPFLLISHPPTKTKTASNHEKVKIKNKTGTFGLSIPCRDEASLHADDGVKTIHFLRSSSSKNNNNTNNKKARVNNTQYSTKKRRRKKGMYKGVYLCLGEGMRRGE